MEDDGKENEWEAGSCGGLTATAAQEGGLESRSDPCEGRSDINIGPPLDLPEGLKSQEG